MLEELCRLDGVDEKEALRRAVRLAWFARTVPREVVDEVLSPRSSLEDTAWMPTGEVRVNQHGRFVAERISQDGATKWVLADDAEVDAFHSRAGQRGGR